MNERPFQIPARLNLIICATVCLGCFALLLAARWVENLWAVLALAAGYAIVMNTGYAIIHEAEHDLLHPNKRVNDLVGSIVSIFFPASFQLRRFGHVGHHLRNRTDDEAFDVYFKEDNALWKHLQFYGIMTGFFWLVILLSNIPAAISPRLLCKKLSFDRSTSALQETLNPKYFRRIQIESLVVIVFHLATIWTFQIPIWRYFAVMSGFGILWSTLQYLHHFGAIRDVQRGAWNVHLWPIFDFLWLNHQWHLNHHLHPTAPWIYLPQLTPAQNGAALPFWKAYLRMWRGPRLTTQRIPNRHAGRIIK
jgi:fatty acid desaturase